MLLLCNDEQGDDKVEGEDEGACDCDDNYEISR